MFLYVLCVNLPVCPHTGMRLVKIIYARSCLMYAGCGKSTLWRILQAALEKIGQRVITHVMNPKSMPRQVCTLCCCVLPCGHELLTHLDVMHSNCVLLL